MRAPHRHLASAETIRADFDRIARSQPPADDSLGPQIAGLLRHVPPSCGRALDIGCGTGLAGALFIQQGHSLYGIDISERMSKQAISKGYKAVLSCDLTAEMIPWTDEFDCAISVGVVGDWIPCDVLIPVIVPLLHRKCIIALTLERDHTDIAWVRAYLRGVGFHILWEETSTGFARPDYPVNIYGYLIALRE